MSRTRIVFAVVAVLALVLLAAACGGGDEQPASSGDITPISWTELNDSLRFAGCDSQLTGSGVLVRTDGGVCSSLVETTMEDVPLGREPGVYDSTVFPLEVVVSLDGSAVIYEIRNS